jgi:uncharacterized UPF0160 family protein
MRLITHDGSFHADDTLAYAILSRIPRFEGAELIRTRDAEIISSATRQDVVFDVGFEFDPVRNRFDHHMRDKPLRDETYDGQNIPYSSVGLVWRFFGEEYLLANFDDIEAHLDQVWDEVDRTLIVPTDMTDNGIGVSFAPTSLSVTIDDFNAAWDDPSDHGNALFLDASAFAASALQQRVLKAMAAARALGLATEAIEASADPQIIVLPRALPWEPAIYAGNHTEALYVISEKRGTWYCQAVRPDEGSFEQRKPLPEQWAGLEGADLAEVTGVPDAVFCHAMRFICAAQSLEGVMALARLAVEDKPLPSLE